MFDFPPRSEDASPSDDPGAGAPLALDSLAIRWQMLVGQGRRPVGVRLAMRSRSAADAAPLSGLMSGVVRGFTDGDNGVFPHGLVLLAPQGFRYDAAMARWTAPRNVLIEVPDSELGDEERTRVRFETRRQGVRHVLRADGALPERECLQFFQYVIGHGADLRAGAATLPVPLLSLDSGSLEQASAALDGGAHAVVGWPLGPKAPDAEQGFSPSQRAILELVRLVQTDADLRTVEQVFEAEPLLAYMLLTLANSPAFRRGGPTTSLRQAVASIGYGRLVKWLVLLLAISNRDGQNTPLIFASLVRAHCMEALVLAATRSTAQADEAFIVGAFTLLDRIIGQTLDVLLREIDLPEAANAALLRRDGPLGPYLDTVLALEAGAEESVAVAAELPVDSDLLNKSLLRAIAMADSMLALV